MPSAAEPSLDRSMDTNPTYFEPDALRGVVTDRGLEYLTHAIQPGTPIASEALITFTGQVRLKPAGRWMPFEATERIRAGSSFQVDARARLGPFSAKIEDSYGAGAARSRVRLQGVVPVRSRRGADLARSARGRLLVESTWLPSAFLPAYGARWSTADGSNTVTLPIDGEDVEATMQLGSDGELDALSLMRWSDLTEDGHYDWVPFEAMVASHRTFGGYTIPSELTATWAPRTERELEFFRARVEDAQFVH